MAIVSFFVLARLVTILFTDVSIIFTHFNFLSTSLIAVTIYFLRKPNRTYLVDFICYRGNTSNRVPISGVIEHTERMGHYNSQAFEFQSKVIERSGIGNESYLPSFSFSFPMDRTLTATMSELETVLFPIVEKLLTKHDVHPKNIDILITNCSVACPTPSLPALIINKFGFRSNVKSYNLSGMGCSASMLSVSLARDLLKVHKNSLVLVLSTESVTSSPYMGKTKSMLLANCLFRMGGAAILLSNRKQDRRVSKYELKHLVRTHMGANDIDYKCVVQEPDDEGHIGISLSRSILKVAGHALKKNLATLSVSVLPYSEILKYAFATLWKNKNGYVPDFTKAFEHFCIHTGGKSVIDGIKENLRLGDKDVEASKMTLYRFGNTSSSSTWYSLSYLEAKGRVKKGDRVWQIGFGSGFKCNSVVWKCISELKPDESNVWFDHIHLYPLVVPDVVDH